MRTANHIVNMPFFKPLNLLANKHLSLPVTLDSRLAKPGIIFIAAPGATPQSKNGHDFISQALAQGCSGLVVEQAPAFIPQNIPVWQTNNARAVAAHLAEQVAGNPSQNLCLCGVTGTNGKTTVTFLLANIAKCFGRKSGVIGTLGSGSVEHLDYSGYTTPEAEHLSAQLSDFVQAGYIQIAMEVSSHALATHRVDGLHFKAAGFTNLSQDHLDFHGDMASYLNAKMRLFTELLPADGVAVIPCHPGLDPGSRLDPSSWAGVTSKGLETLTWGYSPEADIEAIDPEFTTDGTRFTLRIKSNRIDVQTKLYGRFNLDNALCAAGLGHATGISLEAIALGLQTAVLPKGRLERISEQQPAIFVDFAHTPDALEKVLKALREICEGRLIIVFGCGGNRDRNKRPHMARAAVQNADVVIVTQDNPRHEDPRQIIADMQLPDSIQVIEDRQKAIEQAIDLASPDDLIVIAGKGHETTQQIQDTFFHFDDAKVAYEYLLNRHSNSETQ